MNGPDDPRRSNPPRNVDDVLDEVLGYLRPRNRSQDEARYPPGGAGGGGAARASGKRRKPRNVIGTVVAVIAVLAGAWFGRGWIDSSDPRWPEGTTALCADSTYWSNPERSGSCSGHGGVIEWRDGHKVRPRRNPPTSPLMEQAEP